MGLKSKVAIYHDYNTYGAATFDEKELPDQVGDNDVIVKNLIASICGGDMESIWHGEGGPKHMIWDGSEFGHEMVSEVIAVGKNVKGVEVGDWLFPNMGYAFHDRRRMGGIGGFSEYLVLPDFRLEGNYAIPSVDLQPSAIMLDKSLGLENLCMFEPLNISGRQVLQLVAAQPGGKSAVIYGCGVIGLGAALILKHLHGYEKIVMVDFAQKRLDFAEEEYGLLTCNPSTQDLGETLIEHLGLTYGYGGKKCTADVWMDACGHNDAIDAFCKFARPGAVLGITGIHHEASGFDAVAVCFNSLTIKGGGTAAIDITFNQAADLVRSGVDVSKFISKKIKQEELNEAIHELKDKNVGIKFAIDYSLK